MNTSKYSFSFGVCRDLMKWRNHLTVVRRPCRNINAKTGALPVTDGQRALSMLRSPHDPV